jgi:uncharacterized protein (TIGR03067 family)
MQCVIRSVGGIAFAVALAAVASAQRLPAVAGVQDSATLVGTWRAVSIEANGNASRPEDAAKIKVVNTGDGGWTIFAEGKMVAKGTNELLPGSVPKGIDFVVTETPDGATARRHQGIYELQQDTRRLCFAGVDAARPTAFAAPKGSGHVLVTLERVSE